MVEWNKNKIIALGDNFINNVIVHMDEVDDSMVRFGTTGKGIIPNYQVVSSNGDVQTFRGSSHKEYEHTEEFRNERLSGTYTLAEIKRLFK